MLRPVLLTLALLAASCPGSVTPSAPCGGSCGGDMPFCDIDRCVISCPSGKISCSGVCVDTASDPEHCGRCGNECAAGVGCEGGTCAGACAGTMCEDGCVDTANDPHNCGQCERDCGEDGTCLSGECRCSASTTDCGSYCADTTEDPENCGGCGNDCDPGESCVDSDCVCGSGVCGEDQICQGGACACRPGLEMVGGDCVDTDTDSNACGDSREVCDGEAPYCQEGQCVAACDGYHTRCGDSCVEIDEDPMHCGECFRECDVDAVCVDRNCRPYEIAVGCSSCPCDECDDDLCCPYDDALLCVEAGECPED